IDVKASVLKEKLDGMESSGELIGDGYEPCLTCNLQLSGDVVVTMTGLAIVGMRQKSYTL
nr:hypothetical protein [Tanacetum cinerariifolium]